MSGDRRPPLNRSHSALEKDAVWIQGRTDPISDHYKLGRVTGHSGTYGTARLCTKHKPKPSDPVTFAVKIIPKATLYRHLSNPRHRKRAQATLEALRREVEVMRTLEHPNIVKLYDVFEDRKNLYIVMEYCDAGELFEKIVENESLTEADAANYVKQLLSAVNYLHEKQIFHGDLKPENILFSSGKLSHHNNNDDAKTQPPGPPQLTLKIIDFGFSRFFNERQYFSHFSGTVYYAAPEVLERHYLAPYADMYSIGVILFVMLHGYPPFNADVEQYGSRTEQQIKRMIKKGFNPTVLSQGYGAHFTALVPVSASARDLITKLLTKDIKTRLTAVEALEHPWVTRDNIEDTTLHKNVMSSLRTFLNNTRLKQVLLQDVMVDSLDEVEVKTLQATFKSMDKNGDGVVSLNELTEAMRKLDSTVHTQEIADIMAEVDLDGNGVISYEELLLARVHRKITISEERMWAAFCAIDANNDGQISAEELQAQLQKNNQDRLISLEEVKEILAEVDLNGDGFVDYSEFVQMWAERERREYSVVEQQLSTVSGRSNSSALSHRDRESAQSSGQLSHLSNWSRDDLDNIALPPPEFSVSDLEPDSSDKPSSAALEPSQSRSANSSIAKQKIVEEPEQEEKASTATMATPELPRDTDHLPRGQQDRAKRLLQKKPTPSKIQRKIDAEREATKSSGFRVCGVGQADISCIVM